MFRFQLETVIFILNWLFCRVLVKNSMDNSDKKSDAALEKSSGKIIPSSTTTNPPIQDENADKKSTVRTFFDIKITIAIPFSTLVLC